MDSKAYRFDEATHTHYICKNGVNVIVPGITTILKPLFNFSAVPDHILKASCEYGSNVHKMVELYCMDALDTENLDPVLIPSLIGFKTWLESMRFDKSDFIVELPMGDPTLMVACIPDIILDGKLIVELKTRKCNQPTDSIQTCCQESVWKKNGGTRIKEYERRVLTLNQDGSYDYVRVNDKQSNNRFRLLLDHYWNNQTIQIYLFRKSKVYKTRTIREKSE